MTIRFVLIDFNPEIESHISCTAELYGTFSIWVDTKRKSTLRCWEADRKWSRPCVRVCVLRKWPPCRCLLQFFFSNDGVCRLAGNGHNNTSWRGAYQYLSYVRKRLSPPLLHFSRANYPQRFLVTTSSHISEGREFFIVFINYFFSINHTTSATTITTNRDSPCAT